MLLFKIANLLCLRSSMLTFQLAAGSDGSVSNSVAQPAAQKQKAPPKPNDGAATAPAPVAPPQKKQKTAAAKPNKFGGKTKASTELICGCVE